MEVKVDIPFLKENAGKHIKYEAIEWYIKRYELTKEQLENAIFVGIDINRNDLIIIGFTEEENRYSWSVPDPDYSGNKVIDEGHNVFIKQYFDKCKSFIYCHVCRVNLKDD